jgi:serine/threonine-protein kinase HipA
MAGRNKITLLHGVIFNVLIGNGDAHGKNFSLLYDGEAEMLAPFYDLLCTLVYADRFKAKMAMKIGGTYKFQDVYNRHWLKLADAIGVRRDFMKRQVLAIAHAVHREAGSLHQALNADELTASPVYDRIMSVVSQNYKQLTLPASGPE